jgi:hypothetical protein
MHDGTVSLAPLNLEAIANLPRREEIQKLFQDESARFKSGERSLATVFAGPIRDQFGLLRIQGRPDLTALFSPESRWLVENVIGQPEP